MIKIEMINLMRFRNFEHHQFMTEVNQLIIRYQARELGIEAQYPAFQAALAVEGESIRVAQKSAKTKMLDQMDDLRDDTWNAIYTLVKATLLSPVAAEVASAGELLNVLNKYGDPRRRTYNEETSVLSNLLTDLNNPANQVHVQTLKLSKWLVELKKQNDQFQEITDTRNSELVERESGDVRAARMVVDPLYTDIIETINAALKLKIATPAATDFATALNGRIDYNKNTLASRKGRRSLLDTEKTATTQS